MARSRADFTLKDDTLSIRFDYGKVAPEYRKSLQDDALEIRARLKETALSMMDIGERLSRCRPWLPHGAWIPWLLSETGMSESWARGCIKLFQRFGDQMTLLEGLDVAMPPTAIIRLASAPEAALEDVRDQFREGGKLSVAEVEVLIRRHRKHEEEDERSLKKGSLKIASPPVGIDALKLMANQARDVLVPLIIERMQMVLAYLQETEDRYQSGHKISLRDLQANLREPAQWLTDALEQTTQRRAASRTKLVHQTFLDRPEYSPGPWAEAASFLHDLSASSAWERIRASDVPELLRRGREALQAVLPTVSRSFFRYS